MQLLMLWPLCCVLRLQVQLLSFFGPVNFAERQDFLKLAVDAGEKLGSGGFGCVYSSRLASSSDSSSSGARSSASSVGGLPSEFVIKLSRFGSLDPFKLQHLPRVTKAVTKEYGGLGLLSYDPHAAKSYLSGLAVARLGTDAAPLAPDKPDSNLLSSRTCSSTVAVGSSSYGGGSSGKCPPFAGGSISGLCAQYQGCGHSSYH